MKTASRSISIGSTRSYALIFILYSFCFTCLFSQKLQTVYHPVDNKSIQDAISSVSIDTLLKFVKELSGAVEVIINGKPETILSRNRLQPGNELAAQYVMQKFKSYELETHEQVFGFNGKNIYAVQKGIKFPNQKYIICAHYDDMPEAPISPGADDNASGSAAVIEASRILSKFNLDYTVIYALWDEEEHGLLGSKYFAENAKSKNDSILGVINLDMIAWDSNNDNVAEIHCNNVEASVKMSNIMLILNYSKNINLNIPGVYNPGLSASDHASFWASGFPAIMLMENYFKDFNKYYHSNNDLVSNFNTKYFEKCTKLAIATLTFYAKNSDLTTYVTQNASVPQKFLISQNYPNPFNTSTNIRIEIPEAGFFSLKIFNILGNEIETLAERYLPGGIYIFSWSAGKFSSGIYYCKFQSDKFTQTIKIVLNK